MTYSIQRMIKNLAINNFNFSPKWWKAFFKQRTLNQCGTHMVKLIHCSVSTFVETLKVGMNLNHQMKVNWKTIQIFFKQTFQKLKYWRKCECVILPRRLQMMWGLSSLGKCQRISISSEINRELKLWAKIWIH